MHETETAASNQSAAPTAAAEPDTRKCRTGRVDACWLKGEPLVSHCLNEQENCRYGRGFAYGCLCRHPHHLDFTAEPGGAPPEEER